MTFVKNNALFLVFIIVGLYFLFGIYIVGPMQLIAEFNGKYAMWKF